MKNSLNFSIVCAFCLVIISQSVLAVDEEEAALYLQKFGYLEDSTGYRSGAILAPDSITNALKDFQRFAGINQTGVLDNETLAMMYTPRCGVKDRIGHSDTARRKRYALQGLKEKPIPPPDEEPSGPPPDTSDAPDLCQDASLDTVTRTQNGSTYVFKGEFYWKILKDAIADGYPRRITEDWNGLEGNLDASLTWSNGKTYFFKGGRYWRFTNKEMDTGYPKILSRGFEGIPDMLDAAFVWSGNGKTYFFKDDKYWRYDSNSDPPVSSKYPKPISNWKKLPNNIDAAFQWENSKTYFFKGDKYYRFNDISFEVDSGSPSYPRSTSVWWFDCQSISHRINTSTSTDASTHSGGLLIRDNNTVISIDNESSRL